MILDNIKDQSTMEKFSRTCRSLRAITAPRVHAHLIARASFDHDIARLIMTTEKYLTVAQRRMLRQETEHEGQQEICPNDVDECSIPTCTDYVRRMGIYVSTIGYSSGLSSEKTKIAFHYLEESLRVMSNLEVLEIHEITSLMAKWIAKLNRLKALYIHDTRDKQKDMHFLTRIKNLEHLSLESTHSQRIYRNGNVFQPLLLNSRLTLKSLWINSGYTDGHDGLKWLRSLQYTDPTGSRGPILPALSTLNLSFVEKLDPLSIQALDRIVDFLRLQDLCVEPFQFGGAYLFRHLAALVASTQPQDIRLRGFRIHMTRTSPMIDQVKDNQEALYEFILSFNALTTLRIPSHENREGPILPGSDESNMFHQAIINHNNLRALTLAPIDDDGAYDSESNTSLSLSSVIYILDNLPQLEIFGFPPLGKDWKMIGEALSHGKRLTDVTCYPFGIYQVSRTKKNKASAICHLFGILDGLMDSASKDNRRRNVRFVWEEVYRLKRLNSHVSKWEIGSRLQKDHVDIGKTKKRTSADGKCEVKYRDIEQLSQHEPWYGDEIDSFPRAYECHYGYDWMEWVSKQM